MNIDTSANAVATIETTTTLTKIPSKIQEDEYPCCPICLDTIDSLEVNYMATSCGHKFHTTCLLTNISRNRVFTCPYCRQNLIGECGGGGGEEGMEVEAGMEDGLGTGVMARERARPVVVEVVYDSDSSDSVDSAIEPDSVWPIPEADLDEEEEEDPVMEIINSEHDAARSVGLPSPYDLSVEVTTRFNIHMIDLIRILLVCYKPDETNPRWNLFTTDIFESYNDIITADTLETTFYRVRDSMHNIMMDYYREWINQRRLNRSLV